MIRRGGAETAPKMPAESLLHRPVGWLPSQRLTRSFLKSSFVVANTGAHLSNFSSFCWGGERCMAVEPDVGMSAVRAHETGRDG
jgi:hypothetical protein